MKIIFPKSWNKIWLNVIGADEVYVVTLILCGLKTYSHSMRFRGFRLSEVKNEINSSHALFVLVHVC